MLPVFSTDCYVVLNLIVIVLPHPGHVANILIRKGIARITPVFMKEMSNKILRKAIWTLLQL